MSEELEDDWDVQSETESRIKQAALAIFVRSTVEHGYLSSQEIGRMCFEPAEAFEVAREEFVKRYRAAQKHRKKR